jgi:hypothetical protein
MYKTMQTNLVSATFTAEDRQNVMNAIATIKQAMPFLVHLTKEQRKTMTKAGDRSRGFMLNCLDAAQQHTDCLPRTFNVEEMQKDVQLMEALYPVLRALTELLSLVDNTYFAAQSESYVASLKVYNAMKAHKDMQGIDILVEHLQQQFARRNKQESSDSGSDPKPPAQP